MISISKRMAIILGTSTVRLALSAVLGKISRSFYWGCLPKVGSQKVVGI